MRSFARSTMIALLLLALTASSTLAFECVVVNRSATGNEHATTSGRWMTITLEQLYSETENFGLPDLTAAQVAYAVALAESWGVPESFTFRSDKILLEDANGWQKGDLSSDGKGIDHFVDAYGAELFGALYTASSRWRIAPRPSCAPARPDSAASAVRHPEVDVGLECPWRFRTPVP